jgi:endo-1,4-beta-xylanase
VSSPPPRQQESSPGDLGKYTWVPIYYKRQDGLPNRPLPLDRDMQVKPMYSVVSEFMTRCGA